MNSSHNKQSFFLGVFLCVLIFFTIGATYYKQVTGPSSSTDNAILRWDGLRGERAQNSGITILDNGTLGNGTWSIDSSGAAIFTSASYATLAIGSITLTNPIPSSGITNPTASRFAIFGPDNKLTNDIAETGTGAPVRATDPTLVSPAMNGNPTVNGTNFMELIASAGGGGITLIDGISKTNVNFRSTWYAKANISDSTNIDWIPQPVSSANAVSLTPDFNASRSHEFTLTNTAATLNAPIGVTIDMIGDTFRLVFIQDSIGNRTLTSATNYLFGSDITGLTLSTNSGSRDYAVIYVRRIDVFDVIGFVRGYIK